MGFLLLRLTAPLQAWGTRSRFEYRDTEREPSFSGIIGLLAAALGRGRDADLTDLRRLHMTVRADHEGEVSQDYQTAQGVLKADGKRSAEDTQIIYRDYLADAEFHVALEGDDALLKVLFRALQSPYYPVFLGRKSYVPAVPIVYPGEESLVMGHAPLDFLRTQLPVRDRRMAPSIHRPHPSADAPTRSIRFVFESSGSQGDVRVDTPLAFSIDGRRYAARSVETHYYDVPVQQPVERRPTG